MQKINVGLIGFGTIGAGVADVLLSRKAMLRDLSGIDIELKYICDKDLASDRGIKVPKSLLTKDADKILKNPDIDIVVELIGGIHPAKEIILSALRNRKHVVTANKALLAAEGREIFKTSLKFNKDVRFEASVGGGIPIIKSLREGFISNKINEIYGIINGTCNYILSRMSDEGCDFAVALKAAQRMGVAEADPALDVSGMDSAHKLMILAALSFGAFPKQADIYCEGILHIEPLDICYARDMGYSIKLLAITKRSDTGLEVRVHPTFVPANHLLANVKGVFNAIYVKGDMVGEALFYGQGAGREPTASAVVSDIVDLAKLNSNGRCVSAEPFKTAAAPLKIKKMDRVESRYYIRFSALDKPGVLARIAGILGRNGISIATVAQGEELKSGVVPVVIMTHLAVESRLRSALDTIDRLSVIKKKSIAIRVEALSA